MNSFDIVRTRGFESPELLAQAWNLRHRVFRDGLGWDVKSLNNLEYDGFDSEAIHCFAIDDGAVVGYWRALCTVRPYLLEARFTMLLRDRTLPKRPDIWELSRFLAMPEHPDRAGVGRAMFLEGAQFGIDVGARELVAVVEPPFARMIRSLGIPVQINGAPMVVGRSHRGDVRAVMIALDVASYLNHLGQLPARSAA